MRHNSTPTCMRCNSYWTQKYPHTLVGKGYSVIAWCAGHKIAMKARLKSSRYEKCAKHPTQKCAHTTPNNEQVVINQVEPCTMLICHNCRSFSHYWMLQWRSGQGNTEVIHIVVMCSYITTLPQVSTHSHQHQEPQHASYTHTCAHVSML
jgi:hypothetical protein